MGCELNPKIPYTEFSVIIKKQKEVKSFLLIHFYKPTKRMQVFLKFNRMNCPSGFCCFSPWIQRPKSIIIQNYYFWGSGKLICFLLKCYFVSISKIILLFILHSHQQMFQFYKTHLSNLLLQTEFLTLMIQQHIEMVYIPTNLI